MYLIYAYQYNKELLLKGLYRGHDEELLGHYRRECLLVSPVCRVFRLKQSDFKEAALERKPLHQAGLLCDLRLFCVTPFPLCQTSSAKVTQQNSYG